MDLLDGLNQAQSEAVQITSGPLLILAGAGSGKTKTLTHRIAYLIANERINQNEILAVTFTNKAAKEMTERINNIVGGGESKNITMGTFHSVFSRILRFNADKIG